MRVAPLATNKIDAALRTHPSTASPLPHNKDNENQNTNLNPEKAARLNLLREVLVDPISVEGGVLSLIAGGDFCIGMEEEEVSDFFFS